MTEMTQVGLTPMSVSGTLPLIFVETTAIVDRLIGERAVRQELDSTLAAHEAWSSTYVIMEFRRTAIHALDVVRRLAMIAPDDQVLISWILNAIRRRNSGNGRLLTDRQKDRALAVLSMVIDRLGSMPAVRAVVVSLLDSTIITAEELVWQGIAKTANETDCDLVRPERAQGKRWPLTCNARRAQCRQSQFLDHHRARMGSVMTECSTDARFDDTSMLKVLQTILATVPLNATGQRRCWRLGDLIMALESLPAGKLLSSNAKHFEPVCRALGVTLVSYSP